MARGFREPRELAEGGTYGAAEAIRTDKAFGEFIESRIGQEYVSKEMRATIQEEIDKKLGTLDGGKTKAGAELLDKTEHTINFRINGNRYQMTVTGLPTLRSLFESDTQLKDSVGATWQKAAALAVQEGRFKVKPLGRENMLTQKFIPKSGGTQDVNPIPPPPPVPSGEYKTPKKVDWTERRGPEPRVRDFPTSESGPQFPTTKLPPSESGPQFPDRTKKKNPYEPPY